MDATQINYAEQTEAKIFQDDKEISSMYKIKEAYEKNDANKVLQII